MSCQISPPQYKSVQYRLLYCSCTRCTAASQVSVFPTSPHWSGLSEKPPNVVCCTCYQHWVVIVYCCRRYTSRVYALSGFYLVWTFTSCPSLWQFPWGDCNLSTINRNCTTVIAVTICSFCHVQLKFYFQSNISKKHAVIRKMLVLPSAIEWSSRETVLSLCHVTLGQRTRKAILHTPHTRHVSSFVLHHSTRQVYLWGKF